MLYGIDIHPQYQSGFNIERAAAEGITFLSAKLSEGTDNSYLSMGSADWLRRGKAAGLHCLGYHYLRPGNEAAQARVFAAALKATGVPGVLDAEAIANVGGVTTATLTIQGIRAFVTACRALGVSVPLMYLPRWYHKLIGSPSLAGLPTLWASGYPTTAAGGFESLYAYVGDRLWANYGSSEIAVLQYSDCAHVAGMAVDANAYQGTRAQFSALLGLSTQRKDHATMIILPSTPVPADLSSDPATWPQRNHIVGWNVAGGWQGDAAFSFGVQDWPGPDSGVRGYLLLASWILPPTTGMLSQLVPVDPLYTKGRGRPIYAQTPTPEYKAPPGCVGVSLNYAAPAQAGAFVPVGRSA